MRRLSRPSSMTIYVAMWPFPLTSFHASFSADPQTWQVCCGGYWSLLQAVQCCKTSCFSFTASQKGLLNTSGTGITFGIVLSVLRVVCASRCLMTVAPCHQQNKHGMVGA